MVEAMKTGNPSTFGGTIDMYPQEGKYHYDGHRKCQIRWSPVETLKHHGICPVCGKKVTVGVTNRIVKLSDRKDITQKENRLPYYSLIPLKEMISEIEGVGEKSKKVSKRYEQLINKAGSEFNLLHFQPLEQVREVAGEVIAEGIRRMRNNEVIIKEGYDGEYGQIKVFQPDEVKYLTTQESLFDISSQFKKTEKRKLINFDLTEYRKLEALYDNTNKAAEPVTEYTSQKSGLLEGMNTEQAESTQHAEGPAVVLAGPGTGKTKVLTHRIAWLIDERGINPDHVLAITFTNKAAEEMQKRCKYLLGNQKEQSTTTISTFHAFGHSILKAYAEETGRNARFTIADEELKRQIIQDLLQCSQQEAKHLSAAFSRFKQQNTDPDGDKVESFQEYQNQLTKYNLFDLDDLIYQVVQLARSNPVIQENLREEYQWVLVDEFQDINKIQYDLLNIICHKKDSNLFIIGDPNQAIYGFRGSSRKFISHFVEDYTSSRVYKLKTSYRCSEHILKASGDVLQEDSLTGLQEGVRIKIAPQQTEKSEAEYIARTIEQLSGGLRFFSMDSQVTEGESDRAIESLSDFAILCRTKAQMKPIEKALSDHTIPYQKASEEEFFQHYLVKQIRDCLYFAENPDNPYLEKRLKLHGMDFKANGTLEKIQKCSPIPDRIEYIANRFISEKDRNEEVLKQLSELGRQFNGKVDEFLKYLTLGTATDLYEKETEKVSLMTLHASKGLEFQCAFIAGCEKGLIPYELFHNQETDNEEEKRLLYVGMTRAKSYLHLTHARSRFIMGQEKQMQRSPFLNRIEKELTEIEKNTYRKKQKDDSQLKLF
jgi:superfamily I DNA/RNA helicase